jgi:hypothetical protein
VHILAVGVSFALLGFHASLFVIVLFFHGLSGWHSLGVFLRGNCLRLTSLRHGICLSVCRPFVSASVVGAKFCTFGLRSVALSPLLFESVQILKVEGISVLSLEGKQVLSAWEQVEISDKSRPVQFAHLCKLLQRVVHVFGDLRAQVHVWSAHDLGQVVTKPDLF